MATIAHHVLDSDVRAGSDSNTVVLVEDGRVLNDDVCATGDVEAIAVVGGWIPIRRRVGCVSGRVIEGETGDSSPRGGGDFEAVNGPVLNVKVLEEGGSSRLQDNKVIGSEESSKYKRWINCRRYT